MNCYSKMASIYYCAEDNSVYVLVAGWCNNVNAHILSNVYGDYVAKVEQVSALPSTAVNIPIVEFGPSYSEVNIGNSQMPVKMVGSADRPTYNGANMALQSDLPTNSKALVFTYNDDSTETVEVLVK